MQRPVASGGRLPSLPAEILVNIFGYLVKSDIKSVRLVSQEFNRQSSHFLFDGVHFSPQYENLEIFKAVCQNPVRRNTVKELVYDATWFVPEIDKSRYGHMLQRLYGPDRLKGVRQTDLDRGHEMYCKRAQDQISLTAEELAHLCEGLPLLPNLEQVSMREWCSTWVYSGREEESDNTKVPWRPRSHDCWLRPDRRLAENGIDQHPKLPLRQGFRTLMRALSLTGKTIRSFVIDPYHTKSAISCDIFDLRPREFSHTLNIFRNLHKLVLYLDGEGLDDVDNTAGKNLAKLLSAAVDLEVLTLRLRLDTDQDFAALGEFVGGALWPRLHTVYLRGIEMEGEQLLSFLRRHNSRNLKDVSLERLYLLSGLWEDIVEDMQRSLSLNSVCMWDLYGPRVVGVGSPKELETFILHGGENPLR
jgi:hypothetical protein